MTGPASEPRQAQRWLSQGLERLWWELLQAERAGARPAFDFDLLIVGSGYGAAVAAAELAGSLDAQDQPLRIALLERGREYLPGAFPARLADLPGAVRFSGPGFQAPKGRREGLFDIRLGPDMTVVLANGLGGGSLINAGVMEPAAPAVFAQAPWPAALRSEAAPLQAWYERAHGLLGSQGNTIARLQGYQPRRLDWLQGLAGTDAQARAARITVALAERPKSAAGLALERCIACGDCATGCNAGAKESLDTNLLLQAAQAGVQIFTGATVELLLPAAGGGWELQLQHTDEQLRAREPAPLRLRARRVILAAGSLGSTEILLRSRAAGLALSSCLGQRFSGNGDVLAAAVDAAQALHGCADEDQAPAERGVGPTITGLLDSGKGFVVEDLAIPGALRWVWEESFALAGTLDGLARGDEGRHVGGRAPFDDPFAIDPARSLRSVALAIMGLDAAAGELRLPASNVGEDGKAPESGVLGVHWPALKDDGEVDARHRWLAERLATQGARLLANPAWRLLPAELEFLLGSARGPMLTVHPLGGCGMADSAAAGVVNQWGQVYTGQGSEVYPGLAVLDGAIMPTALGINPALTISALALRAVAAPGGLREQWGLQQQAAAAAASPPALQGPRPFYRAPMHRPGLPTLAEFRERMAGFVRLPGAPGGEVKYLELSFVYGELPLRQLLRPGPERALRIDAGQGRGMLRLFDAEPDPDAPGLYMVVARERRPGEGKLWMHAERRDEDARWCAPLASAELAIFHRAPSGPLKRRLRGLYAWFMNRGWRDMVFALQDELAGRAPAQPGRGLWARLWAQARNAWHLASHAGEQRLMDYRLTVGHPAPEAGRLPVWAIGLVGLELRGSKRIGYGRRANPWMQMSRLYLAPGSPFEPLAGQREAELELDLYYLARQRVPLLRLTQAQDLPSAIRDVGALMAYATRMLIGLHAWSMRQPDPAPPREICRLPQEVPGLPSPEIVELPTGRWGEAGAQRRPVGRKSSIDDERTVYCRLTRYRGKCAGAMPLLMIHGYSASGTTFAHHSVQPGPAKLLWDEGYDIWIVDMRTSAGMPTARLPWTFEEAAFNDIPVAIAHILRATGQPRLQVLAHCMGSVMLHMALLEPREHKGIEHFYALRRALLEQRQISKLVISQVTPMLIFSPTNTLRAHLMQYLRPYLPLQDYAFRPEGEQTLLDQLMDRLLATLPYPDGEYDIENPPPPSIARTPWVRTRHRMDMLYGRDFAIGNVDQPVFDHIDDHFGPLSLDTVAQAINFARANEITDWQGASVYLDDLSKSLALLQAFPVLSVHGQDNGLCQAESGELTADLYAHVAPGRYRYVVVPEHGHQDCLIGRHAATKVFPAIIEFLKQEGAADA
ncbi:alpha/beta fold hydrolase [Paucibacter soli]|uniref:alpha/beta fold hydrolase n=1 Tax=Paucibacter soli TaxID=3133433 RepID=UPI0030A91236